MPESPKNKKRKIVHTDVTDDSSSSKIDSVEQEIYDHSILQVGASYDFSPYAQRVKGYEKFLHDFTHSFNECSDSNFRAFVETNCLDSLLCIGRFWCRESILSTPGLNPLGCPNYVELHGHEDFIRFAVKMASMSPDGFMSIHDMVVKTDINSRTSIAICKTKYTGTIVTYIPASMVPTGCHNSSPIAPFITKPSTILPDTISLDCTSQSMDDGSVLHSLRDAMHRGNCYKGILPFLHPLSRYAPSAPSSAEQEPLMASYDVRQSVPTNQPRDGPVVNPSRPLSSSLTTTFLGEEHALHQTPSVQDTIEKEEEEVKKLITLPFAIKGLLIVHFKDYEVNQVARIEYHYYEPRDSD